MWMRSSEFSRYLVLLGDHCSDRCHGSWNLILPDILPTGHWPFGPFKSTGFINGPIKGSASICTCQGLGGASLHLHGFYEVVAMVTPSQLSWTLTQSSDPLTYTTFLHPVPTSPQFLPGSWAGPGREHLCIWKMEINGIIPLLNLTDTMERCKGSMIRDPDCVLVIVKSMQEIKLRENYSSLFPEPGRPKLLQDMVKMHYVGSAVQGTFNNISVLFTPHFFEH